MSEGVTEPIDSRGAPQISNAALEIADAILERYGSSAEKALGGAKDPYSRTDLALLVAGTIKRVSSRGVILGRRPGPEGIIIADSHVSRRHALVEPTEIGLCATDLGSANGTMIVREGTRSIVGNGRMELKAGDQITTSNNVLLAEVVADELPVGPS